MEINNIGITGSHGFIGSNLGSYLSNKGIKYVEFKGDLLNTEHLESFYTDNSISQIIHLAGTFSPPFSNLVEKNVETTQKLLEVGVTHGLKKIIYTSSGAVYGNPINEESQEDDPLKPNTLYGLSKLCAENSIQYYANNNGLMYVILRLPNVYGEGNKKGVIFNFLNDIKSKGKITVAGDGKQRRDFLHISDLCVAIEKAIQYNSSDIFNISSPTKTSLLDLVAVIEKKYKFTVEYKEADNNLHDLILNVEKAKKYLDFQAKLVAVQV